MVFVYIVIALIPLISYILLFMIFTIERPKTHSVTPICNIPTCVRCSKNISVISNAINHLKNVPDNFDGYSRIKQALDKAQGNSEVLLFEVVQLASKPIWNPTDLGSDIADDIRKLEDEFTTIKLASLKLFKNPTMWRKNQETNGTNWFIYPMMMQGTWMEENCNEDLELMEIIHSLSSTMPDCCFGNIFFSLLPPKSVIETHRGPTNIRLRCHFGLEVPEDKNSCFMKVDEEILHWEEGKCFVFDDSLPHSVDASKAKADRLALIIDFWHPNLSMRERDELCYIFPKTE